MKERTGVITSGGSPLTLLGEEIKVGSVAPDFRVFDNGLAPMEFSSLKGKACLIASVPSLDTPVCDQEVRRFNEEAAKLGADMELLTISMDLPFAQKRWCAAAGIDKVKTYSDYFDASFGRAWGLLIKEIHLLARAVYIVDRDGVVQYAQIVSEVRDQPDFDAALEAARTILGK